ncbi:MAG TPA: hypothetical protein VLA66_09145, partial [Thermoanaerobaculia bacterium]|nr:hypothetical protein [Thermoanaerobaculia bacterium]
MQRTEALRTAGWSVLGVALAGAIAFGPLRGIPHVQDEVVYGWQAEQIARGALFAPVPEPRASRVYDFLLDTPRGRVGIFPLGWPLVLAFGSMVGAAAWVNPLLHGLSVVLGTTIARRRGGGSAALLAAPLLALSPQMLLLGASRMSHALAALLVLAAFGLALDPDTAGSARRAALLGGARGAAALVRPLDALLAAIVLVPLGLLGGGRSRRAALAAGAALLAGAGAVALQNLATTGDPATFAQNRYFETAPPPVPGEGWRFAPGCNDLGFGPDKGCFSTWGSFGHTPEKAWLFAERNASLAADLWLGTPWALVLLVPALLSRGGARRAAVVALLLLLALVAGYALYWYGGSCYGARFWHSALPPLLLAVALGAAALLERLRWTPVIALVLVVPMVWSLVRALPELSTYWGIDDRFVRIEESWEREPALVLVAYRSELR